MLEISGNGTYIAAAIVRFCVLPSETFGVMGPHLGYYFSVTEHDELISDINVTENQTQDEKIVKRDNHKHRAHST